MDPDPHESIPLRPETLTDHPSDIGNLSSKTARASPQQPDHDCVICFESIKEPCRIKPCDHTSFHYSCLVKWLEVGPKERIPDCPLCKVAVRKVEYDFRRRDDRSKLKWRIYRPRSGRGKVWSRRRSRSPEASASQPAAPRPDPAVARRREIYDRRLYAMHIGSNRINGYRSDLNPPDFQDPVVVSRARAFLRRELQALEVRGENEAATGRRPKNPEYMIEYILAVCRNVDMQGSQGQAEGMLGDFLGRYAANHLIHELKHFLRSPYDTLRDWDRHVVYPYE